MVRCVVVDPSGQWIASGKQRFEARFGYIKVTRISSKANLSPFIPKVRGLVLAG